MHLIVPQHFFGIRVRTQVLLKQVIGIIIPIVEHVFDELAELELGGVALVGVANSEGRIGKALN